MANLLAEAPVSVKFRRRTAEKLSDLQAKSGIRRSELIRLAVDEFIASNPSPDAVIRLVVKRRAIQ
jgi:hypothetical protein